MTEHILVPIDGSDHALSALDYVLDHFPDCRLSLLTVANLGELDLEYQTEVVGFSEDWADNAEAYAEEIVDEAAARARDAGVEPTTAVELGNPARIILDYADEHAVDHVVIGSHGREGISRLLLGSVAETVARRATVPVTIVR